MRLFVAIPVPEGIRQKLVELILELKQLGLNASFVREEQLHITLLFIGERNEAEAEKIKSSLSKIHFAKFPIGIEPLGVFPNEKNMRVFWAGAKTTNNELEKLHSETASACSIRPESNFTGHITLARIKSGRNGEGLLEFMKQKRPEFGGFVADHFELMQSELLPQGAKYTVVERFGLV